MIVSEKQIIIYLTFISRIFFVYNVQNYWQNDKLSLAVSYISLDYLKIKIKNIKFFN